MCYPYFSFPSRSKFGLLYFFQYRIKLPHNFLLQNLSEYSGHSFQIGDSQVIPAVDFVDILLVRVDRRRDKCHALAGEYIANMLEVALCRVAAVIFVIRAAVGDDDKYFFILPAFVQPFAEISTSLNLSLRSILSKFL